MWKLIDPYPKKLLVSPFGYHEEFGIISAKIFIVEKIVSLKPTPMDFKEDKAVRRDLKLV